MSAAATARQGLLAYRASKLTDRMASVTGSPSTTMRSPPRRCSWLTWIHSGAITSRVVTMGTGSSRQPSGAIPVNQ